MCRELCSEFVYSRTDGRIKGSSFMTNLLSLRSSITLVARHATLTEFPGWIYCRKGLNSSLPLPNKFLRQTLCWNRNDAAPGILVKIDQICDYSSHRPFSRILL